MQPIEDLRCLLAGQVGGEHSRVVRREAGVVETTIHCRTDRFEQILANTPGQDDVPVRCE